MIDAAQASAGPAHDCSLCDRLAAFRAENIRANPDWFNAPVPSFGDPDARLLIVGLAPGLKGANKTGRPFTGDFAGDLLYATLEKFGFTTGSYQAHADDGLALRDCIITNAVRCVPPQNKPVGAEIKLCRPFLVRRIERLPRLKAIIALGRIAHDSTLSALELKKKSNPFRHRARHIVNERLHLFDSYHCSRYNTNTGRLTTQMFEGLFEDVTEFLAQ